MAIAEFLNDDGVQSERIDLRPVQVRHGTSGTGTMTLSPLTRWLFLCASSSSTVWHSSLHTSQEKVILSLALSDCCCCLPIKRDATFQHSSLLLRVLLLVVVAKDLQRLFFSRDSILEFANVHAVKASAWLPSKQGLIRGASNSSVRPGNFQLL